MNFSLQQKQQKSPSEAASTPRPELPAVQRDSNRRSGGSGLFIKLFGFLFVAGIASAAGYYGLTLTDTAGGSTLKLPERLAGWFGSSKSDVLTHTVKRGSLVVTVRENGNIESTDNLEAKCQVEGGTTIIEILPEGEKVTKGQLVVTLDSAGLTDDLANQRIATERATADYENALKNFEVAEINVTEYIEGLYPQDKKTIQGNISLARSTLTRAEERLEWSNNMVDLGYVTGSANLADKFEVDQARFNLEQQEKALEVLEKYTYEKQIKNLQGDVEKAKSDMLAKQSTLELEKEKEDRLNRMIENCKIYAPGNGIIVYHQEESRFGNSEGPSIQEGAAVRERQTIFKLPDIDSMQVNTKVHESMVDKVQPGMSAQIRVDAFPNRELKGAVTQVRPLPDPSSFFSSDVKVYTTYVKINPGQPGSEDLRPGMTAEVTILIARLDGDDVDGDGNPDGVLSIPVQAIYEYGGEKHVWVSQGNNTWENRVVEAGMSNNQFVEIVDGLEEGDVVALDPPSVMTEDERAAASGSDKSRKDADASEWSDEDAANAEKAKSEATPRGRGGEAGGPGGGQFGPAGGRQGGPGGGRQGGPGGGSGGPGGGQGGGGAGMADFRQKMQNLSGEDRQKLFNPSTSDSERKELMKKAGFSDAQIQQMEQMRQRGGGGGGRGQ